MTKARACPGFRFDGTPIRAGAQANASGRRRAWHMARRRSKTTADGGLEWPLQPPASQPAHRGMVNMEATVVAEISQATLWPSPPMRMARM